VANLKSIAIDVQYSFSANFLGSVNKNNIPLSLEHRGAFKTLSCFNCQIAEMARSELGRRLSLQQGVIAAVGLVLGDDDEEENVPAEVESEKTKDKQNRKNECSLETAVQV